MMRLRRASVIATLSLLAWAVTAHAECAWILWHEPLPFALQRVCSITRRARLMGGTGASTRHPLGESSGMPIRHIALRLRPLVDSANGEGLIDWMGRYAILNKHDSRSCSTPHSRPD